MARKEMLEVAKPILFNTDMVRAILDGRKTVTRRICKNGNDYTVPDMSFYNADRRTYAVHNYADKDHTDKLSLVERTCPICLGDILYVRETWCNANREGVEPDYYYYADISICEDYDRTEWKWRPSIHMPKEAARIFLRVTDVRVERLRDITEEQAEKEGCGGYLTENKFRVSPICHFMEIWNSTIKNQDITRHGWDANPWAWVIEFERVEVQHGKNILQD